MSKAITQYIKTITDSNKHTGNKRNGTDRYENI
jgi:hypothetical protein